MTKITATILFILTFTIVNAQHTACTFQDAEKQGLTISHLDSIYQSAVHVDTNLAVFKTDSEQQAMGVTYMNLLQDFGKFLKKNNFFWEKPTRCFNRIYFDKDGSIDYFLYNFITKNVKAEDQLSEQKQEVFNHLLNEFIKDYKISLTAKVKFAQCSPTTYLPTK